MLYGSFKVSPLEAVVLIHHVAHSSEASNDADRTVEELLAQIDESNGLLSKGILESALYCCNMESEKGAFWHPLGFNFDKFVTRLLDDKRMHFDKYYNVIYEVRNGAKAEGPGHTALGSDSRLPDRNSK